MVNIPIRLNDLTNPTEVQRLQNYIQDIYRKINLVTTGTTPPNYIPSRIGDEYVNTSTNKFYKAGGTTNVNDWHVLN